MKEIQFPADKVKVIDNGQVKFTFLPSGDVRVAEMGHVMLNQLVGNPIDGSMQNVYLRLHQANGEIEAIPLMGIQSESTFTISDEQARWEGEWNEIQYQVTFSLTKERVWFWDVALTGKTDQEVDILFAQDIGLASRGSLQANEAYVAQYLDFTVYEGENGYTICNRQNQAQGQVDGQDAHPYLQHGSLQKTVGYVTDGFQFFGTNYKATNKPKALTEEKLASSIWQYEFSYVALQTEKQTLNGQIAYTFYGAADPSHPTAVEKPVYELDSIKALHEQLTESTFESVQQQKKKSGWGGVLEAEALTEAELNEFFPERKLEETEGEELLSFFTEKNTHVVMPAKEKQVERTHGLVLFSNQELTVDNPILTTTSWMNGVFNAQTVIGNTTMNKLLSNTRNQLNVMKASGQRIYVKVDGKYELLGMPSAYEMDYQAVKWIYKLKDDFLLISNWMHPETTASQLEVTSKSGKAYDFYITNQVVMGESEYQTPLAYEGTDDGIYFENRPGGLFHQVFKEASYRVRVKGGDVSLGDETDFLENAEGGEAAQLNFQIASTAAFQIEVTADLNGKDNLPEVKWPTSHEERQQISHDFFREIGNHFHLESADNQKEVEKFNTIFPWYIHNMFVHYLVPHGLEQYGGAAWGTRDVAQGPAEFFMATQKYEIVRDILLKLYAHQFDDDGNWPQWFMFDAYTNLHDKESHGDIIVWPLKILSDYLLASGDFSILEEEIPYLSRSKDRQTEETESLKKHVEKQIQYIKDNFLHGTALSSYGNGDWDDTLQPHDQSLKKNMASSWTVALTYATLETFAKALAETEEDTTPIKELAERIKADYHTYILSDDVIPGFVYMEDTSSVEKMIHPTDQKTGVHYRLLPMIQSITSELFTPEEVENHEAIIERELKFPDGVRLMNQPAVYRGGVSTHFKRAEQAANWGREIGLLYIHAHIRYAESMAKLGHADKAWEALQTINPVLIQETVPNAALRQSNAYFSSSDAAFATRYEASERYQELKEGKIPVKGGWRIYSSGPGIYINQLISQLLGIRRELGDFVFDPTLTKEQEGLETSFVLEGKTVTVKYEWTNEPTDTILVNNQEVNGSRMDNPYRLGALKVAKDELLAELKEAENVIVISYSKK